MSILRRLNCNYPCLGFSVSKYCPSLPLLGNHSLMRDWERKTVVPDFQGCDKSTKIFSRKKAHWQWYFFWRYRTYFNHHILPVSGYPTRKCFPPRIWCSATAKHKCASSPVTAVARNSQPSLFLSQLELQPEVLVDQQWRSK